MLSKLILTLFLFVGINCFSQNKEVGDTLKQPNIVCLCDTDPEFPGGYSALHKFINENINYPKNAVEKNIHGVCYLSFVVNEKGSVFDVKVIRGVKECSECDKEAVRVIEKLPKWKASRFGRVMTSATYFIPIKFELK